MGYGEDDASLGFGYGEENPSPKENHSLEQSQSQKRFSSKMSNTTGTILAPRSGDQEFEDGRITNKMAVTKIRDAWIYKQIQQRQEEFTQYKKVRREG